ncbi:ABC transporter permease [Nesterenkonia lutea]|uniref:ABC-2 type transport system permease protein n=1 Tax=Nesterenkonia lutea TaxID=272919 RepID=A0ABR9JH25_9MICC|nr:ABC transporter permease [Nesterenkonia lutea]MBE1525232.1 ABC-2 type transport system permease protein [Nesterenkonia lutea]
MNADVSHAIGAPGPTAAPSVVSGEVTFARALRAEWLKLTALRLNWWLCAAAVALLILTLIATVLSTRFLIADASVSGGDAQLTGFSLFENVFSIFTLVTILMGALAAVSITTEHTSGSIRSSLAAVPNRTMFYFAKLLAVLGFIGALTAALVVLSSVVLLPLSGFYDVLPELLGFEIWWLVFSSWAAVVVTSAIGFGLGALLRSTAGAVVTYCLLLFSGPIALGLLLALSGGAAWVTDLMRFEIFALQRQFSAGSASMSTDLPVPVAGLLLLVWAAVALVPGWLVFIRRDA